jgi:hypothetical protein
MAKDILERLADGPVLGDGGYIVELEQRGWVIAGAFTPEVVLRHPAAVSELHHEMANAGGSVGALPGDHRRAARRGGRVLRPHRRQPWTAPAGSSRDGRRARPAAARRARGGAGRCRRRDCPDVCRRHAAVTA